MNLKQMQKIVWQNKVNKGFNLDNVHLEFCRLYSEVGEAFDAYHKKKIDFGEELADIGIFLLGLSEMTGIDLEAEMLKKMEKNEKREYAMIDGVRKRIKD